MGGDTAAGKETVGERLHWSNYPWAQRLEKGDEHSA